ncbi:MULTISPECIES: hypothetical protein [unclassified Bradyrhizobium]|uniref:hypothetical protein n=1 Tax=unclassified Bradyrhizobium TaxID=2631580 RepID=UPI00291633FD|nr:MULTISPECIES: hypothetical protein [unclassified Bradyrhizobium]
MSVRDSIRRAARKVDTATNGDASMALDLRHQAELAKIEFEGTKRRLANKQAAHEAAIAAEQRVLTSYRKQAALHAAIQKREAARRAALSEMEHAKHQRELASIAAGMGLRHGC